MTEKEKLIRKAYGDDYDTLIAAGELREDGWSCGDNSNYPDIEWCPGYPQYWRPKELSGIQDNNGWTKIESEEDLPSEDSEKMYLGYCLATQQMQSSPMPEGIIRLSFKMGWLTHFREYELPKPPLY